MAVTDFSLAHTPGGPETFGGVMIPAPGTSAGDSLQSTGVDGEPAEWAAGGGSIPSGASSPFGAVTPTAIGELYVNTTNGTLYIAAGASDTDWLVVGGPGSFDAPGLFSRVNGSASLNAPENSKSILTDMGANAGSGNGLYWNGNSDGDGAQVLKVVTGPDGDFIGTLQDEAGTMVLADGGLIFPTADPHIAGAWWDDAGTLTRSSG